MFSRTVISAIARRTAARSARSIHMSTRSRYHFSTTHTLRATVSPVNCTVRTYSSKSVADEKIEEITELYATAKDEFEIAMEETEKATVYAEDDRAAAVEELAKVQEAYKAVIEGEDKELAEEVKRRIGQRIRELEQGVKAMEELAMSQD